MPFPGLTPAMSGVAQALAQNAFNEQKFGADNLRRQMIPDVPKGKMLPGDPNISQNQPGVLDIKPQPFNYQSGADPGAAYEQWLKWSQLPMLNQFSTPEPSLDDPIQRVLRTAPRDT